MVNCGNGVASERESGELLQILPTYFAEKTPNMYVAATRVFYRFV